MRWQIFWQKNISQNALEADEGAPAPKDLLNLEFYFLEYSTAGKENTTTKSEQLS